MAQVRRTEKMSWEENVQQIMTEAQLNTKAFYIWLRSKEYLNGIFFNALTWRKAYMIQRSVNNEDRDHFIVVSGKEGIGKSTFGIQLACLLDPKWTLDKMIYNPLDLIKRIEYGKKGDCLILDEGNLFLFSREAMTDANKYMVKLFALMRQRNIIIIINVPNFFTLDTYVRDWRVDTLFNITARGKFYSYKGKAIQLISNLGKSQKRVSGWKIPYGTFYRGWFTKYLPEIIKDEDYRKLKGKTFDDFLGDIKSIIQKKHGEADFVTVSEASKKTGSDRKVIIRSLQNGELKGKKIGHNWKVDREALLNCPKLSRDKGTVGFMKDLPP